MCSSSKCKFRVLLGACVTSSLLGIIVAVFITHKPIDGGRGGAVAVALALFNLFINKGYGLKLFEARTTTIPRLIAGFQKLGKIEPTDKDPATTPEKLNAELATALNKDAEEQNKQNWYLACSTFFGTIIWGFGDIFAGWLTEYLCPLRFTSLLLLALPGCVSSLPSPTTMTDRCVVTGLPEPRMKSEAQATETGLVRLFGPEAAQEPKGCLSSAIDRAREDQPILILLVGRTDKRQLRSEARRIYGNNFTLAYQRAASLKAYLLERYKGQSAQNKTQLTPEMFASRIVVLAAGPNHIEAKTSASELSEDRCVEVFIYWNTKPNP